MEVVSLLPAVLKVFPFAKVRDGGIDLGAELDVSELIRNVYGEPVGNVRVWGEARITRAGDIRVSDGDKWAKKLCSSPLETLRAVRDAGRSRRVRTDETGWVRDGRFV